MSIQDCNRIIRLVKDPNYSYSTLFPRLVAPKRCEDYSRDTPLEYACWNNDLVLLQTLIDIQNDNPSDRFADNMVKAMCAACERVHTAAAVMLIRCGIDLNLKVDGTSALTYACGRGSYWFARSYLEYNIPIDNDALRVAVLKKNNRNIIGLLHAYGYRYDPKVLMEFSHPTNVQFLIDWIPGCEDCIAPMIPGLIEKVNQSRTSRVIDGIRQHEVHPIGDLVDKLNFLSFNLSQETVTINLKE